MTLEQMIDLFKRIEAGEEGQLLGYHIHKPVRDVGLLRYGLNHEKKFSDFLIDLKEHEPA